MRCRRQKLKLLGVNCANLEMELGKEYKGRPKERLGDILGHKMSSGHHANILWESVLYG